MKLFASPLVFENPEDFPKKQFELPVVLSDPEFLPKKLLLSPLCILLFATGHTQELHTLAQDFLNTLDADLLEKAQFQINDDERFNFNYVPLARKGPTFNDFNTKQKDIVELESQVPSDVFNTLWQAKSLE